MPYLCCIASGQRLIFQLLLLPRGPSEDHVAKLKTWPLCLRGRWPASYLSDFAGRETCPEGLAEILCVLLLTRSNTSRLESLNATIRRLLHIMNVQVNPPTLRTLSNLFTLNRMRLHERRCNVAPGTKRSRRGRGWRRRSKKTLNKVIKQAVNKPKRRRVSKLIGGKRCGGGAWRAFLKERCRGVCKIMISELAKE